MGIQGEYKFELKGLKNFKRLPLELKNKSGFSLLMTMANPIRKSAIAFAPKGPTGNLKANIKRTRYRGAGNPAVIIKPMRPRGVTRKEWAYYWWYVHFGTTFQSANPYLEKGFNSARGMSITLGQDAFIRVLARLVKKYNIKI